MCPTHHSIAFPKPKLIAKLTRYHKANEDGETILLSITQMHNEHWFQIRDNKKLRFFDGYFFQLLCIAHCALEGKWKLLNKNLTRLNRVILGGLWSNTSRQGQGYTSSSKHSSYTLL